MSENELIQAILKTRIRYLNEGISPNYYEINNGLCTEFAEDVICELGGETEDFTGCCQFNFMVGRNGEENENDIWDSNLLETHWNIDPLEGLTWEELNQISFGDHFWITFNKRHYDAECPEGADNFFELPIFKRYIEKYIKEKKHAS